MTTAYLFCLLLADPIPRGWMDALAEIESGHNDRAVGRHGEVSRFQVKPSVWRSVERRPFSVRTPNQTRGVVRQIWGDRIESFTRRTGRAPTSREAYVLWNAPAQVRRPSPIVRERARRFENLVRMVR